ncbi:uncharacterized protein [Eurosta solidaginis]|uniref:uncharacterized protein n=1 Tax=Eurosta solidaginis TaxID=178769 RepID=UPI0035310D57
MSSNFNKLVALSSLAVLSILEQCSCAPQNYYASSSSPYLSDRTSASRTNPYRRADFSPYRDYSREYYDALKQRRMRALADSYRDIYNRVSSSSNNNENIKTQSYDSSSRFPAVSTSLKVGSKDDNSASNSNQIFTTSNENQNYNNYNRYDVYASNRNRLRDENAASTSTNRRKDATATTTQRPRTSKADEQNAKFAGIRNQEANEEDTPKTLRFLKHKKRRRCLAFGRDAQGNEVTPPPEEQGRILWDLNVYNIYSTPPIYGVSGCSGFGGGIGGIGGLGGGGLFSDPIEEAYAPPNRLNNFLQLFAPGILQNALAATARPQTFRPQADTGTSVSNDFNPDVDANYNPVAARPPPPVRQPNRVYYDSAGAAPVTPAQLVGGVATTVNGIIQQLTGNVQPVYPGYRSLSYGK